MTPPPFSLWHSDAHGAYSLYLDPANSGGHVWIQGRRPYCDRGHWEWGTMGLATTCHRDARPSYYFMRLETAISEVTGWLRRIAGPAGPGAADNDTGSLVEGAFASDAARSLGDGWSAGSDGDIEARAGDVRLVIARVDTSSGVMFRFEAENVPNLDDADIFPRLYMTAAAAQQEAEDFLVWRLLKQPVEIPGPIDLPSRPFESGGSPSPAIRFRARPA